MPLLWNALQWWRIQVLIPPSLCWGQLSQMHIAFLEEPVFTGASPLDYPCNLGHLEIIPVIEGISKACFNFAEFDSGGSTEIAPCLCLAQFWYFFLFCFSMGFKTNSIWYSLYLTQYTACHHLTPAETDMWQLWRKWRSKTNARYSCRATHMSMPRTAVSTLGSCGEHGRWPDRMSPLARTLKCLSKPQLTFSWMSLTRALRSMC